MKIFVGADHGGFRAKEQVKQQLERLGHQVEDLGALTYQEDDDYPFYGQAVAKAVVAEVDARGLVFCRSGHGMVIAANKVKGARAVLATTADWTNQSRTDDDANVLAFGVDFTSMQDILPLATGWLETPFAGGRHQRRVEELE